MRTAEPRPAPRPVPPVARTADIQTRGAKHRGSAEGLRVVARGVPDQARNFEGPLDLLLHLIKKNEVNIYDIPIALITESVPRVHRADAGAEPRRRGRVPGDGGDADPHQVAHAAAAAADRGRSSTGEEEDPREALVRRLHRAPAVQGGRRTAARARDVAQRTVAAVGCGRRRRRGRGRRARARSRSLQPAGGVPRRARAGEAAAARAAAARADLDRVADRGAADAPLRDRGLRLRGAVRRRLRTRRPDRHVPRAARDDPAEAGAHLPVGPVRPDSRLQARAARRRAAPDHGSRRRARRARAGTPAPDVADPPTRTDDA